MAHFHCRTRIQIRTRISDSKPYGYIVLFRTCFHWLRFGSLSHSICIVQESVSESESESESGNGNEPLGALADSFSHVPSVFPQKYNSRTQDPRNRMTSYSANSYLDKFRRALNQVIVTQIQGGLSVESHLPACQKWTSLKRFREGLGSPSEQVWTCLGGVGEPHVNCGLTNGITGSGHMPTPNCEQTDTTEDITFPQLCWRAAINGNGYFFIAGNLPGLFGDCYCV